MKKDSKERKNFGRSSNTRKDKMSYEVKEKKKEERNLEGKTRMRRRARRKEPDERGQVTT